MQRIEAEVEGMQARVGALWENYRQVYGQVDPLTKVRPDFARHCE